MTENKEIVIHNRYNEEVVFKFLDDNHIQVIPKNMNHLRAGYTKDGSRLDFVDPSGGPWLHLGMGLGIISKELRSREVEEITYSSGKIILKIKNNGK